MRIGNLSPLIIRKIQARSHFAFKLDVEPEEIVNARFVELPRLAEKIGIERRVGATKKPVVAVDT